MIVRLMTSDCVLGVGRHILANCIALLVIFRNLAVSNRNRVRFLILLVFLRFVIHDDLESLSCDVYQVVDVGIRCFEAAANQDTIKQKMYFIGICR